MAEQWAGCRSSCNIAAGRGIAAVAVKQVVADDVKLGLGAAAESTATAAAIGERCDNQRVGFGADWLPVGITARIAVGSHTAAVDRARAGHVAGIAGHPFQKRVAGVGIAAIVTIVVAWPGRTGVTVGISGYVGFASVVDYIGAIGYGSRLPLAATPGSTGCTIAHGDFLVDTS